MARAARWPDRTSEALPKRAHILLEISIYYVYCLTSVYILLEISIYYIYCLKSVYILLEISIYYLQVRHTCAPDADVGEGSALAGQDERGTSEARGEEAQHLLQGAGFRVQGSGCRVQGSGFRVQG